MSIATISGQECRRRLGATAVISRATAPSIQETELSDLVCCCSDWDSVLDLAKLHRVGPLLAARVTSIGLIPSLPDRVGEHLVTIQDTARMRHQAQSVLLSQVLDALRARGIETILLKGLAISERFYEKPSMRVSEDMDILVRRADVQGASETLEDLGYRPYREQHYRSAHFHQPFFHKNRSTGGPVELHWDVTQERSPVRFPLEDWWRSSRRETLSVGEVTLPPIAAELSYLAFHALTEGTVTLRDLSDFARARERAVERTTPEEIRREAERSGSGSFSRAASKLVSDLWGLDGLAHSAGERPKGARSWLARNLLSMRSVLENGPDLWWPLQHISRWSMVPRSRAGLSYLFGRARHLNIPAATERGVEPSMIFSLKIGLILVVAAALCCLPGWRPRRRVAATSARP